MGSSNINRLRFGGFIGACLAACAAFLTGDYATAGGLIAAALSTAGGKTE